MSETDIRHMYVGHGALNWIQFKQYERVIKTIVIDAGSNEDHLGQIEETRDWFLDKIDGCEDKSVILCLTHLHIDHYSFFLDILENAGLAEKIDVFYVGGFSSDIQPEEVCGTLWDAICYAQDQELMEIIFLHELIEPERLWSEGGNELWVLFSCICGDIDDLNSYSANYAIKTDDDYGIWFTGDSTGWTFNFLIDHDKIIPPIRDFFQRCKSLTITVPHHGSLNTLLTAGFVFCEQVNGEPDWYIFNWIVLCTKLGIEKYDMIASFGRRDSNNHPSGYAMYIYAQGVEKASVSPGDEIYYEAYKQFVEEPVIYLIEWCERPIFYIQCFTDKPGVRVTCPVEIEEPFILNGGDDGF